LKISIEEATDQYRCLAAATEIVNEKKYEYPQRFPLELLTVIR
jgi:hypothetical protein